MDERGAAHHIDDSRLEWYLRQARRAYEAANNSSVAAAAALQEDLCVLLIKARAELKAAQGPGAFPLSREEAIEVDLALTLYMPQTEAQEHLVEAIKERLKNRLQV